MNLPKKKEQKKKHIIIIRCTGKNGSLKRCLLGFLMNLCLHTKKERLKMTATEHHTMPYHSSAPFFSLFISITPILMLFPLIQKTFILITWKLHTMQNASSHIVQRTRVITCFIYCSWKINSLHKIWMRTSAWTFSTNFPFLFIFLPVSQMVFKRFSRKSFAKRIKVFV